MIRAREGAETLPRDTPRKEFTIRRIPLDSGKEAIPPSCGKAYDGIPIVHDYFRSQPVEKRTGNTFRQLHAFCFPDSESAH